ncbi:DDRGK domain-containing protein 1 [Phymastichus coffea]|uniref:DDRGK domain-containing protein 1 n=1 Tax=Phymastichus coffea TaxID=108790 RepID=UPI00273C4DB0|nr:DDRGK domain-containing protein 1 [Phymastichus coffea]
MEIVLLSVIACLLLVLIIGITWLTKRNAKKTQRQNDASGRIRGAPVRRAAGVRGVRQRRPRGTVAADVDQLQHEDIGSNNEADEALASELADVGKVGAKKRAKLEAKAERKAQREQEEREREERKKCEQQEQEERDRQSAREREEEKRREEAEKVAREEKERREHEEYLKLKEAFSIEEEGYEEKDEEQQKNLLQEFVDYIKRNKVVLLEDLAQQFNLKTANAIERVQQMQADGILSGVIDDRGKFIYISQVELEAVAKFVRQRGRVSIAELAEHSNTLINLNPGHTCNAVEA